MKKNLTKKLTHNLGYKIVAILLAILLWLVVVNIDDPSKTDTIYNIPIEILNAETITDQEKVYTITSSEMAFVKVKGPRSYIDELSAKDFVATADFSTLSITNAVTVNVEWSEVGSEFSKRVEIVESTTTINVQLEDINGKNFEIQVNYIGEPAEGYVINEAIKSVESLLVSAPQSLLKNVASVAVTIDVTDKTEDFSVIVSPKMYNQAGEEITPDENTTFNYGSINVDVKIFKTKTVPINVASIGEPGIGYELSILTLSNESVLLRGKEEDLNKISSVTIPSGVINIAGAISNVEFNVKLSNYLPDNVFLNDEASDSVTVTAYIVKNGEKTFSISGSDVDISSKPANVSATVLDSIIYFTLSGVTDSFDVSQISAYVDLSEAIDGTTQQYVLNFVLEEGIELVSEVKVNVLVEAIIAE